MNATRRPLPSFLIIGAQKAGTTSLYALLNEHSQVSPSTTKEVHYFDHAYSRGTGWYQAHFHPVSRPGEISGESTPYYLFHPSVPARVAETVPEARLIVILRNPVDRAFSHHNHERALGFEDLPFDEAVAKEPERLAGEEERMAADPLYRSFSHQHHSYLARGRYDEQLRRWFAHVDRSRFLVLRAEDLFSDPETAVLQAQEFLGLELEPPRDLSPRNARAYAPIAPEARARLTREFEAGNRRLYGLLGRDLGWG